jgi:hypothetical protein
MIWRLIRFLKRNQELSQSVLEGALQDDTQLVQQVRDPLQVNGVAFLQQEPVVVQDQESQDGTELSRIEDECEAEEEEGFILPSGIDV